MDIKDTEGVFKLISENQEAKEAILNKIKETDNLSVFSNQSIEDIQKEAFSSATEKQASRIEETIGKLTGLDKNNPEEKYYDYLERGFNEFSSNKDKEIQSLQEELENVKKSSDVNKDIESQLKNARSLMTEKEAKWLEEKNKLIRDNIDFQKKTKISSELSKIKFKDLGEMNEAIEVMKSQAVQNLLNSTTIDGEDIRVLGEDGKVLYNNAKQGYPYTVQDRLNEMLDKFIDKGVQFQGTGTKESKIKSSSKESSSNSVSEVMSSSPKDIGEATNMLKQYYIDNNLSKGSIQYNLDYRKDFKELSKIFSK